MQTVYVRETQFQSEIGISDECFRSLISRFIEVLENISITELLTNRTRGIQAVLDDGRLTNSGTSWGKISIVSPASGLSSRSIFKLDGFGKCHCGKHQTNIVLCLNNREAIGTNLLKIQLADQYFKNLGEAEESMGILLCLSRETLNLGGWDKAYADSSEYVETYREIYKRNISARLCVLEVHSP